MSAILFLALIAGLAVFLTWANGKIDAPSFGDRLARERFDQQHQENLKAASRTVLAWPTDRKAS